MSRGERALAASALDRAYGLLPNDEGVARQRRAVLDELAIDEHGLRFRYVPAGTFLMGSATGDPDERPVHRRRVAAFWITDVPLTWAAYCALLGWSPPPDGSPSDDDPSLQQEDDEGFVRPAFMLRELGKIRLQYCEGDTPTAFDWRYHYERAEEDPPTYDRKPLVAISAYDAEELAAALSRRSTDASYRLPTEAEWEKAARGGLLGRRWSWGDEAPTRERCDFDRFGAFHLTDPRAYPPNGYGLHAMCGGVAEWTADRYDALAYHRAARGEPPDPDAPARRVVRGGSWADCADAVTVSFRAAREQGSWRHPDVHAWGAPNIGFRLVRR
ncbi:MAG: SUMF1/EgtB/PvdO family nonheme iron enzyme [Labilithrix sp.]|nr:SUMF1/EgtB/PvdO family nonheme iron enzyme [Labilithrix sp.]MCW5813299.1 SUMF1/EgtB/PvdO family nonheme iron enzyme [Labilithrix sp.]